jgi:hypothetical protein
MVEHSRLCSDLHALATEMQAEMDRELQELGKRLCHGSLKKDKTLDFQDLIGSTILDVGFHPVAEEGGFTIDYQKGEEKKRIVLGFTELGMWKYYEGLLH